ncbi:MAG: choice-of-anchor E domain-containing protein [Syntrophobacteraceae bacterium]|jgi:hypothetical protein|nr:choice-of-anchor E domain-containing protein [Syntrophobacteraceae bacterium]
MKERLTAFLACLAVVALWAGPSRAALVVLSDLKSGLTPIENHALSLARFDPALGTLQKATFTLIGTVNSSLTVSTSQNPSRVTWEKLDYESILGAGNRYFIDISGPSSLRADDAFVGKAVDNVTLAAGQAGFFTTPGLSAFSELVLTGSDLAPFMGSGSVQFLLNANSFDSVSVTGGRSFSIATSYEGSVRVAYDYAPVPIPGAAWLLGSGVAGLAGLRRKLGWS